MGRNRSLYIEMFNCKLNKIVPFAVVNLDSNGEIRLNGYIQLRRVFGFLQNKFLSCSGLRNCSENEQILINVSRRQKFIV